MNIYTRRGDDGSTQLRSGERVRKDDARIELVGTIDEAQAALGVARAEAVTGDELDEVLVAVERDLWILMSEVTTTESGRVAPVAGLTAVDGAMVERLEREIDRLASGMDPQRAFSVPGENRTSAALDLARTIVRRAERLAVSSDALGSSGFRYLNRLSDLCWMLARSTETERRTNVQPSRRRTRPSRPTDDLGEEMQ